MTPAVGPLTTLAGWRAFVHRTLNPPTLQPPEKWAALAADQKLVDADERIGYHAELLALQTPELHQIVSTGRSLLMLNHRQHGARRGLLVSGDPTTGKSTAITQLGRAVELAHRRTRPPTFDGVPVVYLTMPPQATPKSLSIEILKFLGAPYLIRSSLIKLTRQACHLLSDLGSQLILVDEIHNLNHHTKAGADASDHLKYLAEKRCRNVRLRGNRHAGTGLFSGVRGRQLAGRFVSIVTKPFAYSTSKDRDRWEQLVDGFDQLLRLHHQKPGALTRLSPHLYGRAAGSISSLSMMIRSAAISGIIDGTERITKAVLDAVPLDHTAATAGITVSKGRIARRHVRSAQREQTDSRSDSSCRATTAAYSDPPVPRRTDRFLPDPARGSQPLPAVVIPSLAGPDSRERTALI